MASGPRVYWNAGRRHAAKPKDQQLMARGINKVILVGNLGNDPEVKYTQGGMAITKTSLATSSVRKDRDGNQQEKTEWHRVTFFGKLGEIAAEYLRKGSQVYVEGEIRYSEHTGDDGQKRYYTDIIANEMQMLGGRGERTEGGGDRPARSAGGPPQRRETAPSRQAPKVNEFADDFADDDIPF